jgi:hypothetical protein
MVKENEWFVREWEIEMALKSPSPDHYVRRVFSRSGACRRAERVIPFHFLKLEFIVL